MDFLKLNFFSLEFSEQKHKEINTRKKRESDNCDGCEKQLKIITLDQLSCHDKADDCWVAICDRVYNCTEFLKHHPGGEDVIAEYAGRDATLAFIGYGHTSNAMAVLEDYLIGELPLNERLFAVSNDIKMISLNS